MPSACKIDKDEFLAKLPVKLVSAPDAARAILRGVERNESIIVFPFYARLGLVADAHQSAAPRPLPSQGAGESARPKIRGSMSYS